MRPAGHGKARRAHPDHEDAPVRERRGARPRVRVWNGCEVGRRPVAAVAHWDGVVSGPRTGAPRAASCPLPLCGRGRPWHLVARQPRVEKPRARPAEVHRLVCGGWARRGTRQLAVGRQQVLVAVCAGPQQHDEAAAVRGQLVQHTLVWMACDAMRCDANEPQCRMCDPPISPCGGSGSTHEYANMSHSRVQPQSWNPHSKERKEGERERGGGMRGRAGRGTCTAQHTDRCRRAAGCRRGRLCSVRRRRSSAHPPLPRRCRSGSQTACSCVCAPPHHQHSTAQHSTAQHSTAQHSTAQHSMAAQARGVSVGDHGTLP